MKQLEKFFIKRGFHFTQRYIDDKFAIYELTKPHYSRSWFDVIRVKLSADYTLGGVTIEGGYLYPSSSTWGLEAWTCETLEAAQSKIEQLRKSDLELSSPEPKPEPIKKEPQFWPSGKRKGRPPKNNP